MSIFFAFVGVVLHLLVFNWPTAVVGVRADGLVAWQSPTTGSVPASMARAQYVVGVVKRCQYL